MVFFVGDFILDTGPGIANKLLRKGIGENKACYSEARTKLTRILEMIIKIRKSHCVCFCSPSRGNILGIRIANFFNKKSFYVMHGYLTFEKSINTFATTAEIIDTNKFEQFMFMNVEKVFCVSKKFMNYMKNAEPKFNNKFSYNYNGIDFDKVQKLTKIHGQHRRKNQIISVGGGMRQKNNVNICKAIDKLNKSKNMNLEYIVIGLPHTEKEKICDFNFVEYYDKLPNDEVLNFMAKSFIYVQNSSLETFGISVIEALYSGCNLLVSKNVGVIDCFKTIKEEDIIENHDDIDEIADKIETLLGKENNIRLIEGLDTSELDYRVSGQLLLKKINASLIGDINGK